MNIMSPEEMMLEIFRLKDEVGELHRKFENLDRKQAEEKELFNRRLEELGLELRHFGGPFISLI